jgi:DNA helicase-2/ATP-dependent DNA helicase PcrA
VGGVAFYKRKEIKDILAYLKVVVNPRDEESLLRVLNVPSRGIGETSIRRLRALGGKYSLSLLDVMGSDHLAESLTERAAGAIRTFQALLQKYIGLKEQMSPGELARSLVDEIGVAQRLKDENTPDALARRENVLELVSALSEFTDRTADARLEQFLEEVSLVSDVDTADFSRNAVTLMTLHAAKGLEFPVVFISGLEEGLFPLGSAAGDRRELEEERRLMYVGITRAMAKLYLAWAQRRYRSGVLSFSTRSRFLEEIDPGVVSTDEAVTARPYRRPLSAPGHQTKRESRRPPSTPAETFFSDSMPAYEDESQDMPELHVGARVNHETFGAGRIVALTGNGEQARAVVEFDSVGRKNLMLKFAHLRPLDSPP